MSQEEAGLLRKHGLLGRELTTFVLGHGRQTRRDPTTLIPDTGYMDPYNVVECPQCLSSRLARLGVVAVWPHMHWYAGRMIVERHHLFGLRLQCFYSMFVTLLRQANHTYLLGGDISAAPLAQRGRAALVRASMEDMTTVQAQRLAPDNEGSSQGPILMEQVIGLRVRRLKVLDLIDELPLLLDHSVVKNILASPPGWHRSFHPTLDAIQLESWKRFPEAVVAALRVAASSG